MQRAKDEFHIENPKNMFVAEAFSIQDKIIKGRKRHAKQRWTITRYRYVNLFVRLVFVIKKKFISYILVFPNYSLKLFFLRFNLSKNCF